jgi:hypothetical protein
MAAGVDSPVFKAVFEIQDEQTFYFNNLNYLIFIFINLYFYWSRKIISSLTSS